MLQNAGRGREIERDREWSAVGCGEISSIHRAQSLTQKNFCSSDNMEMGSFQETSVSTLWIRIIAYLSL